MAIHFDTQGPAPDGFHVPLTTEWQAIYNIWTALGGGSDDGTNFGIALKLPFAGMRSRTDASVKYQGTNGFYWASTHYNENRARRFRFSSSDIYPQDNIYSSNASSVRCFKDVPISFLDTPLEGWTVLYQGSGNAGIYRNQNRGVISLSSDGQTWITIADKNLGATTVWNSGDTLNQANCGKYYQWGNNYGFDRNRVDPIATSSTQVDASNYGPGNYYSSSTFITRSSSPYRWDTTDNGNLWGGVTKGWWYDLTKLHGAIHTFHFTPTLMSISDLEALPDTTGLSMSGNTNLPTIRDELNKYPEIYYATFRDSGNLYTYMGCNNALGDGTNPHEGVYVVETLGRDVYFHFVYFNENTRKRVSTAKTRSLSTDV